MVNNKENKIDMETKPQVNNWPDDVRLKMVERSEFYSPSEKIYQFGYYDGYQKAFKSLSEENIRLSEENKKLSEGLTIAYMSGVADEKERSREEVKALKEEREGLYKALNEG